mmetsp:Transcript_14165/g.18558  ORF Transcript_14165/g.18558 Transcript_14165/m.18558 type:complete len:94 (+) Transcript_14165:1514-1795(+)
MLYRRTKFQSRFVHAFSSCLFFERFPSVRNEKLRNFWPGHGNVTELYWLLEQVKLTIGHDKNDFMLFLHVIETGKRGSSRGSVRALEKLHVYF